jgi:hypothetical protein
VADALKRGQGRWFDGEYLNRIIFSEMIKDEVLSDIGYGIGFNIHGDVWKLVVVNHIYQTIGIKTINYDNVNYDNYDPDDIAWDWIQEPISFNEFVDKYQHVTA